MFILNTISEFIKQLFSSLSFSAKERDSYSNRDKKKVIAKAKDGAEVNQQITDHSQKTGKGDIINNYLPGKQLDDVTKPYIHLIIHRMSGILDYKSSGLKNYIMDNTSLVLRYRISGTGTAINVQIDPPADFKIKALQGVGTVELKKGGVEQSIKIVNNDGSEIKNPADLNGRRFIMSFKHRDISGKYRDYKFSQKIKQIEIDMGESIEIK